MNTVDHYIVSGPLYKNIKYRRGHLVDYLKELENTSHVYWIIPSKEPQLKRMAHQSSISMERIDDKLTYIHVRTTSDVFLYTELMSSHLYNNLQEQITSNPNKKILWYTRPQYPFLSKMKAWDSVVYDCSDLWVEIIYHRKVLRKSLMTYVMTRAEQKIVKRSTDLFSTTPYLSEHIYSFSGKKPYVIENGVSQHMLEEPSSDTDPFPHIPKPRIGYVGTVRRLVDIQLLHDVAIKYPTMSLVFIGPVTLKSIEWKKLSQEANVFVVDQIPITDVPRYMRALDVGLLPYRPTALSQATSPLKFFEYVACGIPVVGSGLPTIEKYREAGVYDYANGSSEQFAEKCIEALEYARDVRMQERRRNLAKTQLWHNKFTVMVDKVMNRHLP